MGLSAAPGRVGAGAVGMVVGGALPGQQGGRVGDRVASDPGAGAGAGRRGHPLRASARPAGAGPRARPCGASRGSPGRRRRRTRETRAAVTHQPDERVEEHHRASDDDGGREVEAARHMRTLGRPPAPQAHPRLADVPDPVASLRALAELPGVPERIAAAREACERLRWHEALRRRIPEASAESRVRGAQASAALEGATVPLDLVRDVMRGAAQWPLAPDPWSGSPVASSRPPPRASTCVPRDDRAVAGAGPAPRRGGLRAGRRRPARPSAARGRGLRGARRPRPRPHPRGRCVAWLDGLVSLWGLGPRGPGAGPVVAASPTPRSQLPDLQRGNGVVARAVERALVQALGLDPTGVVVTEAGHAAQGGPAYLGALGHTGRAPAKVCPCGWSTAPRPPSPAPSRVSRSATRCAPAALS